uniref:Uncharacterized protein n=1 Tax=Lotus japonicus TaxID=34305 RepID=I3SNS3_LOTJA|nr:unknown [Lotus japonicus]
MVLSNKKLKQKLRAESAQNLINSNAVVVAAPDTSFKQLLDTASHTPRLSKRDVLRKLRSLQPPSKAAAPKDKGTNKENGVEDLGNQKKENNNKKRKGEVKDDDDVTNGVISDASESKKQKQNKAKSKKQNKAKSKEQKQNKVTENGSNNEPEMSEATELTKTNPSIR